MNNNNDTPTNEYIETALHEFANHATEIVDLWYNLNEEQIAMLEKHYPFEFNFEDIPHKIFDWLNGFIEEQEKRNKKQP